MSDKILFVDDEPLILEIFRRQFRKDFEMDMAGGGLEALALIKDRGPYAVIVSDQHMPGMDGTQFLAEARRLNPDSVRIMLTGNADLQTAITAVNDGRVFRFLTKPTDANILRITINGCIAQHHLLTAERELLESTLAGTIEMMSELLSLVNPLAFSQTARIRRCVRLLGERIGFAGIWQLDMASSLSQIGCVTIPPETLRKAYRYEPLTTAERDTYHAHPEVAANLIKRIPRLEAVAEMIRLQQKSYSGDPDTLTITSENRNEIGGHMLRVAVAFDQRTMRGMSPKDAIEDLAKDRSAFHPVLVALLRDLEAELAPSEVQELSVRELKVGQILHEDLYSSSGMLMATAGTELTETMLMRLRAFSLADQIQRTVSVINSKKQ